MVTASGIAAFDIPSSGPAGARPHRLTHAGTVVGIGYTLALLTTNGPTGTALPWRCTPTIMPTLWRT